MRAKTSIEIAKEEALSGAHFQKSNI